MFQVGDLQANKRIPLAALQLRETSDSARAVLSPQLMRGPLDHCTDRRRSMFRIAGFILVAVAAGCAVGYWHVDRQLQAFRLESRPSSAYLFVPIRWRRELYKPEGH